jgi:hypothetical protein
VTLLALARYAWVALSSATLPARFSYSPLTAWKAATCDRPLEAFAQHLLTFQEF